jgi:hypothetical protein
MPAWAESEGMRDSMAAQTGTATIGLLAAAPRQVAAIRERLCWSMASHFHFTMATHQPQQ